METTDASAQQGAQQLSVAALGHSNKHKINLWRIDKVLIFVMHFWHNSSDMLQLAQVGVGVCACVRMMLLEHIQTLCFPLVFVGKLLRGDQHQAEGWALFLERWACADKHSIDCKDSLCLLPRQKISFPFLFQVSPLQRKPKSCNTKTLTYYLPDIHHYISLNTALHSISRP